MPRVTVLTPLYNSSAFLRRTLDSLIGQTYTDWESILVDDGSTDNTVEVVKPYLDTDNRFRLVQQENQGIASARNTAIKHARGEWICLLDHDDRWLPAKLEKQLAYADKHNLDMVCSNAFVVTETDRWIYTRGFSEVAAAVARAATDPSVDVFEQCIRIGFLCASTVMLKHSLFERHGLFDPAAVPADDYDMWLRCIPDARLGFIDEPLIEYFLHAGNYSRNEIRMTEAAIAVLQRHRKRHASDHRRLRQFNEALGIQFSFLFERLAATHSNFHAIKRLLKLAQDGPGRAWVLNHVVAMPFSTRLRNSVQYRLGLTP